MKKISEISPLFLESAFYGFSGTIFVLIALLIEEILTRIACGPFACHYHPRNIPIGIVFICTILLFIFWNLWIKSVLVRWFLILVTSSITAISIQTIYLVSISPFTIEQMIPEHSPNYLILEFFGVDLMVKLFLVLTPFTVLFANRHTIIKKIKNRNKLK